MKYLALSIILLGCFFSCHTPPVEEKKTTMEVKSFLDKPLKVYTTASETELRLSMTGEQEFKKARQPLETEVAVFVNPAKTFQKVLGIGGAITDASAEVFAKLSKAQQENFLKSYYDKEEGIGYTLGRTSIHSCDFSSGSFTYVSDSAKDLNTFNIDHDRTFRIPMIKRAIAAAGGSMMFYASPWSPPPFMKTNKHMLRGGSLLPEYAGAWALYYSKFIKAYEKEGIPIWGLTIQNEPMAVQRWESCIYTAEQERDFLKNHLGPTLQREGLGDKKIIVWDHNRDLINHRANTIFSDPAAAKYAWGIGFHWYENWTGGDPMFNNLGDIKEAFADKNLVFTEGCNERFDSEKYEYWPNAERYGRSMINDFNEGVVAWTDWNILLNDKGGPNHVGNFCFAPVHATEDDSLIFTPTYYYIGHFSKFVRPGAKRVSTSSSRSALLSTSFENEDGSMVSIVMNHTDEAVKYFLFAGGDASTEMEIPARAMQTIIY